MKEKNKTNDSQQGTGENCFKILTTKSYKFADMEKTISNNIHKHISISAVDDHTLNFSWKTRGFLSFLGGKTKAIVLRAIGVQENKLFLFTDTGLHEDAGLLLDDLTTAFNNGVACSAWEWSESIPQDAEETPMTRIGENLEDDSHTSTPGQEAITVYLDRMALTSDFMKANEIDGLAFDDEGINIDCNLPAGSRPDGMASIEAIGYLLQGSQYEGAGRYKEAAESYRMAAVRGNATAQNNLGFLYANGLGVQRDDEEAYKWYCLAAEQEEPYALSNLGDFYAEGKVVDMDKVKAIEYYTRAADLGLDMAQAKLGVIYFNGDGTEIDHEKALQLFLLAGNQGYTDAMRILGICYHEGYGTEKDDKEALKWYQKAAEAGDSDTQCNLAIMLFFGQATKPDKEEAKKWLTKSAQQGNTEAIKRLGILFGDVDLTNYVDLGLPSGTLWADKNVGAKGVFDLGPLQKADGIDGLPTYDQAVELIQHCEFYKGTKGELAVWKVQGPNGNHILFVESDDEVCGMPAAICCCSGATQDFRPFLMICSDNITVGMTMIEDMPARRVKSSS